MNFGFVRSMALGVAVGVLALTGGAATASPVDYEGNYDATSVVTSGNFHTVWLPGLFSGVNAYWQFVGGAGNFVVGAGNATATLDGQIVNNVNANLLLDLDIDYTLRSPNAPAAGGTKNGGIDGSLTAAERSDLIDSWSFFDMTSATLTGSAGSVLEGLVLTLTAYPVAPNEIAFQLGDSANDKNQGLGGSGWFTWTIVSQATNTNYVARLNGSGNPHGDININLEPVPLPAAGWLLVAGVGGLAAMRRRKRPV